MRVPGTGGEDGPERGSKERMSSTVQGRRPWGLGHGELREAGGGGAGTGCAIKLDWEGPRPTLHRLDCIHRGQELVDSTSFSRASPRKRRHRGLQQRQTDTDTASILAKLRNQ